MSIGSVSLGAITPVLTRRLGVDAEASSADGLAFATTGNSIEDRMIVLASI
jgi:hypothetical protein